MPVFLCPREMPTMSTETLLQKLAFDASLQNKPQSKYIKKLDETVYWIPGTGPVWDKMLQDLSSEKNKQRGFCKAVFYCATDDEGNRLFKGQKALQGLYDSNKQQFIQAYGNAIMGEDEEDDFGDRKDTNSVSAAKDEAAKN